MSPDEQKRLGAFLRTHAHRTAQGYLGLKPGFETGSAETALEKRRMWAQGQQTNPKFQDEAIWILSNLSVLREALNTPAEEMHWLETTHSHEANQLQDADLYGLLGLSKEATIEQIQDAHRLRYRDARHLKNRNEAHQIYAALDEAWRVLNDPDLRKEYDSALSATASTPIQNPTEMAGAPPPNKPSKEAASILAEKEALTQAPTLQIRGKRQLSFSVSNKILRKKIRIERDGPGLVDATLRSDQPWLTARPERLEPHASSQDIHIQIDPSALSGQTALGQIIVNNFNGQRLAVHIKVTKRSFDISRLRRAIFWRAVLLGGLVAAPPTRALFLGLSSTPPTAPVIHLHIEPGPATVFLNNEKLAEQTDFVLTDLPSNRPFVLRVEKPGHVGIKETIALSPGQERKMTVTLEPIPSQDDK